MKSLQVHQIYYILVGECCIHNYKIYSFHEAMCPHKELFAGSKKKRFSHWKYSTSQKFGHTS